jgi:dolichol-phosphate mannosyltransferase
MTTPALSIICPIKDEADNIAPLFEEFEGVVQDLPDFEFIVVNDGSVDATLFELEKVGAPWLRVISHKSACGKSAAMLTGIRAARAPIVATLDGDLQNPPDELIPLTRPLLEDEDGKIGLVAGQRIDRQDTNSKRWASRLANGIRKRLLKDDTRDTACGLKAVRRDLFLAMPYFDNIHRFLPALTRREGYEVVLIDVVDRERGAGDSKYTNWGRLKVGIADMLGVWWLIHRRKRPNVLGEGFDL